MEERVSKIQAKYNKASEIKNRWNDVYDDVAKYVIPNKYSNDVNSNSTEYEDKQQELYTSTGINATNNFVNKIQSTLTPINYGFISLKAGNQYPQKEEIDKTLDQISQIANSYKNGSNFDSVIPEFYYELVLGTACLLVQGGGLKKPLSFKVIPFKQYSITENFNGEVDGVFRTINIKATQLKYVFPDCKYTPSAEELKNEKELDLLETTMFNYETEKYDYILILQEEKKIIIERQYKTNPFIVLRWNKQAGEIYGRGIGLNALNDLKTLNRIMEYSLRAFAFNIPTFIAEYDGVINPEEFALIPGNINFVKSTMSNNPSIMPLNFQTDHNVNSYNIERMQMDIKRTMYDITIPDNNVEMTATEINRRTSELNGNFGSMFGRINLDFMVPLVKRIIEVLQDYFFISKDFDIDAIDGYGFKVEINTPLSKQNKAIEQQGILETAQILLQLDPTGNLLNTHFNLDKTIKYIADTNGVPVMLLKTQEEIAQQRQAQAQAQAQQQQQQMNNQIYMTNEMNKGKENAKKQY